MKATDFLSIGVDLIIDFGTIDLETENSLWTIAESSKIYLKRADLILIDW